MLPLLSVMGTDWPTSGPCWISTTALLQTPALSTWLAPAVTRVPTPPLQASLVAVTIRPIS